MTDMLDTNQINQAFDAAQTVHSQLSANWPAITAVAVIVARELANLNRWLVSVAGFVIARGGAVVILKKLLWNPGTQTQEPRP